MKYFSLSGQYSAHIDDATQYATIYDRKDNPVGTLTRRRVIAPRTEPAWTLHNTDGELIYSWRFAPSYDSLMQTAGRMLVNKRNGVI